MNKRNSNPNLDLRFLVDLAQKDAGHHEARDEHGQIDKCEDDSGATKAGIYAGAEGCRDKDDADNVASTERYVDIHQIIDRFPKLAVGILAGDNAGQDRCNDRTNQANKPKIGDKKGKDPEQQSDCIEYHDGDDQAARRGDFSSVIGGSQRDGRGRDGRHHRGSDRLLGCCLAVF